MKRMLAGFALLLAAACATNRNSAGWTGQNTMPFDHAVASCQVETQVVKGPAFEVCMASKGWTRPQR